MTGESTGGVTPGHIAGRALDALIAEKVTRITDCEPVLVHADGRHEVRRMGLPHYSTDIAAAWEVLNHLGPEWWPEVGRMDVGDWYCELTIAAAVPHLVGPSIRVVARTAPHAICLAALAATNAQPNGASVSDAVDRAPTN